MGTFILCVIVILVIGYFINKKIEDGKQNKIRKVIFENIDDFYTEYYSQLTTNLQQKYPFIGFTFLSYEQYKADNFFTLIDYKQSKLKIIHTLAEPLVSYCIDTYLNHYRDFTIPQIEKNDSDFWGNEEKYRTTEKGRNPTDWSLRRELVYNRDNGQCQRCGKNEKINTCHIHHIIRRANDGNHALENLVVLCRSCHTLMDGHSKMQSFRDYYISKSKIIHIIKCQHSFTSQKKTASYGMLRNKGFTGCKICKPWIYHENAKSEWKYEIEFHIHKTLKAYLLQ
ncbi:MAG: HNH endonuclease signature motif containing protein [Bacteroidia bacterium]